MMASFVKLLLEQAERQAKARETLKYDEAATRDTIAMTRGRSDANR
jgi:hypothetical protein